MAIPQANIKASSGTTDEMVLVGCRLPNGFILSLGEGEDTVTHVVKGTAHYIMPNDKRKFTAPDLINGAALTPVPKKFWEAWSEKYKNSVSLRGENPSLFAATSRNEVSAIARDHEKTKTGLEPLDPKSIKGLGIETATVV